MTLLWRSSTIDVALEDVRRGLADAEAFMEICRFDYKRSRFKSGPPRIERGWDGTDLLGDAIARHGGAASTPPRWREVENSGIEDEAEAPPVRRTKTETTDEKVAAADPLVEELARAADPSVEESMGAADEPTQELAAATADLPDDQIAAATDEPAEQPVEEMPPIDEPPKADEPDWPEMPDFLVRQA